jgi:hypothetical protein
MNYQTVRAYIAKTISRAKALGATRGKAQHRGFLWILMGGRYDPQLKFDGKRTKLGWIACVMPTVLS